MKHTFQRGRSGRYDEICERLGLDLKAAAAVLIVIGGRHGDGMSASFDPKGGVTGNPIGEGELAALLREMAEKLEAGERPDGVRFMATDEVAS